MGLAGSENLHFQDALSLLSNPRRRMIITALQEVGGEACLREVARRVAEMEGGGGGGLPVGV